MNKKVIYGRFLQQPAKRFFQAACLALLILLAGIGPGRAAYAETSVVRAVLFFSRTCPHCHKVMSEDLPPLVEQYGEQLSILAIDTVTEYGRDLFLSAISHFQIPMEQQGVPMLIVGDTVLMGSLEIPQRLPGIVEAGLAAGGIDWPDFPGLPEILEAEGLLPPQNPPPPFVAPTAQVVPPLAVAAESLEVAPTLEPAQDRIMTDLEAAVKFTESMTMAQRFAQDPSGNTLAVVVLMGLVLTLFWVGHSLRHRVQTPHLRPGWWVPVLVLLGTAVALYLSFVEITQTEAVCGPVGHCNTVQQSAYARLFGLLPIGVLGVLGYGVIGLAWLAMSYGPSAWRRTSTVALWLLALVGTLFSLYLTFLEPFVIGASCVWCLSSAGIMALLLWLATSGLNHQSGDLKLS